MILTIKIICRLISYLKTNVLQHSHQTIHSLFCGCCASSYGIGYHFWGLGWLYPAMCNVLLWPACATRHLIHLSRLWSGVEQDKSLICWNRMWLCWYIVLWYTIIYRDSVLRVRKCQRRYIRMMTDNQMILHNRSFLYERFVSMPLIEN